MTVMRVRRASVALLLLAAITAVGCGAERGPVGGGGGDPTQAGALPEDPTALPAADVASYQALLEDLRGTPVVVNVWASWCGPCRVEAPALTEVATEYGDRVQFLGIDVLDARPDAEAFITEFGWPYPSLFDEVGAIRDSLGLVGQPYTLFYEADGTLLDTHMGSITVEQLRAQVEDLVA
jgi:thiol-disulfide isomerase/thioredoxin